MTLAGQVTSKTLSTLQDNSDYVDLVVGPGQLHQIPKLIEEIAAGEKRRMEVSLERKEGSREEITPCSGVHHDANGSILTIAGNVVVSWSYFGTNLLGVGLHAYGFNNTLARGLVIFWLVQLAFIVVGLLPIRFWRGLLWRRN